MGPRLVAILLLLISIASIQIGASVAKHLFTTLGPEGMTVLRVWIAAVLLFAFWRPWREKKASREAWGWVVAYGVALGGMNLLFYLALARIPLGIAVAFEFVGPLAVALLASRRALDFAWAALALAGMILIGPTPTQPLDALGIFFALAAGTCWGLYIVFGQRVGRLMSTGQAAAFGMAVSAFVILPPGLMPAVHAIQKDAGILTWAVLVALFSGAIPYSLEMFALKRLPAQTFGILMSLEPAIAALTGLAILGESLSPRQWVAIAAIMTASAGAASAPAVVKSHQSSP